MKLNNDEENENDEDYIFAIKTKIICTNFMTNLNAFNVNDLSLIKRIEWVNSINQSKS